MHKPELMTPCLRALQERLIATRIIHYNNSQMFFECNHGIVAEDGSRTGDRYTSLELLQNPPMSLLANDSRLINHPQNLLTSWHNVVSAFGKRNLTVATDKLPACKFREYHPQCLMSDSEYLPTTLSQINSEWSCQNISRSFPGRLCCWVMEHCTFGGPGMDTS